MAEPMWCRTSRCHRQVSKAILASSHSKAIGTILEAVSIVFLAENYQFVGKRVVDLYEWIFFFYITKGYGGSGGNSGNEGYSSQPQNNYGQQQGGYDNQGGASGGRGGSFGGGSGRPNNFRSNNRDNSSGGTSYGGGR